MLKNQRGNILFWVLSAVLVVALVILLLVSESFNLDPVKNLDNCTTYMKNIWVSTRDFVTDKKADFPGDLSVLRTTRRPDGKSFYLNEEKYCPETQSKKEPYLVVGKFLKQDINGERKELDGVIVLCPRLADFGKHVLSKSFFDNQSSNALQRRMNTDLETIVKATGNNFRKRADYMGQYYNYWKNNKMTTFQEFEADPAYGKLMIALTGVSPIDTLATQEQPQ